MILMKSQLSSDPPLNTFVGKLMLKKTQGRI